MAPVNPRCALALAMALTVLLSTVPLASAFVATPRWTVPMFIETPVYGEQSYCDEPVVAMNNAGDIFAAWVQTGSSFAQIWANHYRAGSGWAGAVLLDPSHTGNARNPAVAVSASGAAAVVWEQRDGGQPVVFASYFTPGAGWSADVATSSLTGFGVEPVVAMDASGVPTAAWMQNEGARYDVYASRYAPGMGWGGAERMEVVDEPATFPAIAVDAAGNVAVAFIQGASPPNGLYANRYVVGTGWTGRTTIDANASLDMFAVELAAGGPDQVMALYIGSDGMLYHIIASYLTASGGWSTGEEVSGGDDVWGTITLSAGPGGTFEAGFIEQVSGVYQPFVARSLADGSWAPAEQIVDSEGGSIIAPEVVPAPDGSAVAMGWMTMDSVSFFYAVYRSAQGVWGAPEAIDPDHLLSQTVASGSRGGSAAAVMLRYENSYGHAFAATYTWVNHSAPALAITGPADGAVSASATARIGGTVTAGASVAVNGVMATISGATFEANVALLPGNNTVTAVATDAEGDTTSQSIAVEFREPASSMQAELAATQANLSAARTELASTQANLSATQANLSAAQASLAAARADLEAAKADLNTTRNQLASTSGSLSTTQATVANQTREIDDLKAAPGQTAASDSMALMVGLLGIVLGAAGLGLAAVSMRKKGATAAPGAAGPPKAP